MALDAAQNGKGFEDEVDLDLTHTPLADGGSDVKRRLALEERERNVSYIMGIVTRTVETFMQSHVIQNDSVFSVGELAPERVFTQQQHIRLQARCAALLRRLFTGDVARSADSLPSALPRTKPSIEDEKAAMIRRIAERMVDHVITQPGNGTMLFDVHMIETTTETIMQSIVEHPGMSPQSIVDGFLSEAK